MVLDGDIAALRAQHQTTTKVTRVSSPQEDIENAKTALSQLAQVKSCEFKDHFLHVSSDEPNGNFVLSELLQQNILVLQFAEDEPNLEDIFMRSTAGKVT